MTLQMKPALPLILESKDNTKISKGVFYIINRPRNFNHCKLSCKVQKLTRCHMKIFLKVSKSKYFVPGPVKSFSKFFFL